MTERVKKIFKTVRSVLFVDPRRLYEEDRAVLNEPFSFSGSNGKAILLLHGWTSVPYEVRRLGIFLNENGYTVAGPLLRGHGTVPKDLEGVAWNDWLKDVENEYLKLRENHRTVFVIGTSIGGNLSALLAVEHPEIRAVVLLATPFTFKLEKAAFWFAKGMRYLKRYNKKFYPPTFGLSTTLTRLISYQTYPISSALEAFKLVEESRRQLKDLQQPCLMMQSSHDHLVARDNLEKIYRNLGSGEKKKQYIDRAYHTFISDIKNEHVFEDILKFLEKY